MRNSSCKSISELDSLIKRHREASEINQLKTESTVREPSIFENRIAFSINEAAFISGISTRTVERLVKRGELRIKRVGRRVLIPKEELGAWLIRKE